MNINSIILSILLSANLLFGQAPQKMSYQAVIRNSSNTLVMNTVVGMRTSILQSSATGTTVYVETQKPTTNTNGLASIEIGSGTLVSGSFATIDWSKGPYFVKTETDISGGTNYSIIGTSQLLSVPYALYAKASGTKHYVGESYGGGTVFYVYDDGMHGLIAANTILPSSYYNAPFFGVSTLANGINGGKSNTTLMFSGSNTSIEKNLVNSIPEILPVSDTTQYGDWYIPSKYELNLLFQNRGKVPSPSSEVYISSTTNATNLSGGTTGSYAVWFQNFANGIQTVYPSNTSFNGPFRIRLIRSF